MALGAEAGAPDAGDADLGTRPSAARGDGLGEGERERAARDVPAPPDDGRVAPAAYEVRVWLSPRSLETLEASKARTWTSCTSAASRRPQHEAVRGTTTSGKVCRGSLEVMSGNHSSLTAAHSSLKKLCTLVIAPSRVISALQQASK